jgi:predicted DNA-binding protein YlxM (UPF0122 family)
MDYETSMKQYMAAARKRREYVKRQKAKGVSLSEIARELGVTRQRVQQIVKQAE